MKNCIHAAYMSFPWGLLPSWGGLKGQKLRGSFEKGGCVCSGEYWTSFLTPP